MAFFEEEQSINQETSKPTEEESEEFKNMTLSDFIEKKMLPRSLECGISMEDFFSYTMKEIKIIIKAFNERRQEDLRLQSQMDYVKNTTLTSMIACLFSKDAKMPTYEQTYAFLYDATEICEIQERKEEAKREAELKRMKASMLALANSFNAKMTDNKSNNRGDGQ